jgi:hypothetical protein
VFGAGEAHVLPALAAVVGAIDAVAVTDRTLTVVLASADPDDVAVPGVEGDAADGVGALLVEDSRPGSAGVGGLPDAAAGDGDVVVTTRPLVRAGPRERNLRPLNGEAEGPSGGLSVVFGSSAGTADRARNSKGSMKMSSEAERMATRWTVFYGFAGTRDWTAGWGGL